MGLFFAWAIGETIVIWRWVKAKAPPTPGALAMPSLLFIGLAIVSEYRPARSTAIAFAFAVDLAVLLRVIGKDPSVFQGTKTTQPVTGWPPPKLLDTQIWPGTASVSGGGSSGSGSTFPAVQGSAASEAQQAGGFLPGALFGQVP